MRRAAQRIVEKLRLHGYEAFFAGGWVRDYLLHRRPQDIDIATSALPDEVLRLFPHATPTGAKFGVVQVRSFGHSYDVTTFRSEGPYLDGRHPSSVSFSGPRQDALRRDFTVNGLFYDPIADRVIDYVRGAVDVRRRVLRTIGKAQERFGEDKLRMLRAVRFSCNLDFRIAPETFEAIQQLAPLILDVSWERIRDELSKLLTGPSPGRGLELLSDSGLLLQILPEVAALRGVQQPAEFHPEGDVYIHTRNALALMRKPSAILAFAVLLHDIGKPATFAVKERIRFDGHVELGAEMAEVTCRRLRLSNDATDQIVDLIRGHLRFMSIRQMRPATLKRFLRRPNFKDHLELHRLDCLSSHGDLEYYRFAREQYEAFKEEPPLPPRLISGNDLLAIGYTQGPIFRQILDAVEDLHLENPSLNREQALEYVRRNFPLAKPAD